MSLQDQLLKAGLVNKDQVKKSKAQRDKQQHQSRKNKALGRAEAEQQAAEQARRSAEQAAKREHDRQWNQARQAEQQQREQQARIRQLIAAHRVNDKDAETRYHFSDGRFIRSMLVTDQQQRQLALGLLGLVRNDDNPFDFPLLPRDIVLKIQSIDQGKIILLYPQSATIDDTD